MHTRDDNNMEKKQEKNVCDTVDFADSTFPSLPLTYSTERVAEPLPPTWHNLLDDLSKCSFQDPVFKRHQEGSGSMPVVSQEVNTAQVRVEVQVAARTLSSLLEVAAEKHHTYKNSLELLKDELEDLT